MPPSTTQNKQSTPAPRTRRSLLKGGAVMAAIATIPFVANRSVALVQSDSEAPDATPEASPHASPAASAGIEIGFAQDLTFDPAQITIPVGTTVTWMNDSPLPHTATCDPAQNPANDTNPEFISLPEGAEPQGSAVLFSGDSFSHEFTVAGTYNYICVPHVMAGMRGVIIVE